MMRTRSFVSTVGKWFMRPSAKIVAFGAVAATMLVGFPLAFSQIEAADNGPTQTGSICMQKVYGTPVANSNLLNCTANDIRLARAVSVFPDSCISGSTIDLQATFEVDVTANSRYDAGFFFRIDGGDNARGDGVNADGICSLSAGASPPPENPPFLDLDGDTCGDLNSGTYLVTFTIPGVACVGVPDPDDPTQQVLKLPNCTSWHNNQGTVCSIDNAFDFDPDTKAKCVCDDDFTVPVRVEEATITVEKTASPISVPEPRAEVTYNVQVTNDAAFESVTITTVTDNIYGDLTDASNPNVTMNTCTSLVGMTLGPGGMAMCSFKAIVAGDAADVITDIVEVCSTQDSTGAVICDDDDASVTITDVSATPALMKTALSAGCTVDVNYQVVVSNNSEFDELTVNSLNDDKFGDITLLPAPTGGTPCSVPQTIAPLGNYTCDFVGTIVSPTCDINHVDTVTGDVTDDDGVNSMPSDSAQVTVTTTTM